MRMRCSRPVDGTAPSSLHSASWPKWLSHEDEGLSYSSTRHSFHRMTPHADCCNISLVPLLFSPKWHSHKRRTPPAAKLNRAAFKRAESKQRITFQKVLVRLCTYSKRQ
mmetsp:Transcript_63292/g.105195  ORF Transcript_63292/g.105195 Transcript_63292/m.105195 type:complete len:109 (-) Transcript_63292:35-361(-)